MGSARKVDALATTARRRTARDREVRALAWKILYANHRPSLGPKVWEELVDAVDGPTDVKTLTVDAAQDLEPFVAALEELADRVADDRDEGLRRIGRSFVDRWATMYQTLVEHLDGRPRRIFDVALEEVIPWFFAGASLEARHLDEGRAEIVPDDGLPQAFQVGLLEGFLAQVGARSEISVRGDAIEATWTVEAPSRPHPLLVLAEATRARFLTATLIPVLVGTALAFVDGGFSAGRGAAALGAAALLHLSANLLNDVFDHRRGVDEANLTPTPFSGGSRVIQRGLLGSRRVLALAIGLALVGTGLGLWLASQAGIEVLGLGLAGVALGYAYSGEPFRLSHRGLGEAVAGLVFGPLIAGGAYAVQVDHLTAEALLAGVPVGLLMAGLLAVNELPDAPWDERTGKRTLVVRLGEHAPAAIGAGFALAYASIVALVLAGSIGWPALVALATAPLAVHVVRGLETNGFEADKLVPYQAAAFWLHASTGALIAAGIAIGGGL